MSTLNALKEMGGDQAQGYFISKPLPWNEMVKYLNEINGIELHLQIEFRRFHILLPVFYHDFLVFFKPCLH